MQVSITICCATSSPPLSSSPLIPSLSLSALPPPFPSPSVSPYLPSLCPSLSLLRASLRLCVSLCVSLCFYPSLSMRVSLCRLSLSLRLCVSLSLSFLCLCRSFSLSARCTRDRVLRERLSASWFGVSIDGSDSPSTDAKVHTSCVVSALILSSDLQTTARVPSSKDWTVSVGSHTQLDVVISEALPHLGAPFPLFDAVHVRTSRSTKLSKFSSHGVSQNLNSYLILPTKVPSPQLVPFPLNVLLPVLIFFYLSLHPGSIVHIFFYLSVFACTRLQQHLKTAPVFVPFPPFVVDAALC